MKKKPLEEATELLGLIDVEFRTDPMSVQCFDLRLVGRVRMFVLEANRPKAWKKNTRLSDERL